MVASPGPLTLGFPQGRSDYEPGPEFGRLASLESVGLLAHFLPQQIRQLGVAGEDPLRLSRRSRAARPRDRPGQAPPAGAAPAHPQKSTHNRQFPRFARNPLKLWPAPWTLTRDQGGE